MSNIPKSARWDPSRVMGSADAINLVTGARSLGKTYAMKKQAVKQFLRDGSTWGYLRYNDAMIKRVLSYPEPFFGDIMANNEFPNYLLRNRGKVFEIAKKSDKPKWVPFGSMIALTSFDSYKGSTTPNMKLLVFDEFIKEKEKTRSVPYPHGAVNMFYNLYETLDRREDRLKVVMLANSADLVNPFFRAWGISVIERGTTKRFAVGKTHVFYENAWNPEYQKFASQTNLGMLTAGSEYEEYSVDNNFASANGMFVRRRPKDAICMACFVWRDEVFAMWASAGPTMYVNDRPPKDIRRTVLTKSDMTPDYQMIDQNSSYMKRLLGFFKSGSMYFDSDAIRESMLDMMNLCGLR